MVPGGRSRASQKLPLRRRRAHGFLACSIPADSKSGQFKVHSTFDKPQFWPVSEVCQVTVGGLTRFRSRLVPPGKRCTVHVLGEESLLGIGNSVSIRSTTFRGILSHLALFQCYRSDLRSLSNCQSSWRRVVVLLGLQLWLLGCKWMVAICRSPWNRK